MGTAAALPRERAYDAIAVRTKLEAKQAVLARRHGREDQGLANTLGNARAAEARAIALVDDVALLARWPRDDLLSLAGSEHAIRRDLFDFVVAEPRARESACPHRLRPVRTPLENQRDNLLAFALKLDQDLRGVAQVWQIPEPIVRHVLAMQALAVRDPKRQRHETVLRARLRGRYHGVYAPVRAVSDPVARASSLVANLNSRLRNYFIPRRHLGQASLTLLQFFLNHRRYPRSDATRVPRS